MTRTVGLSRWALVGIAVATLALGGCGRKGMLDLPPGAPDTAAAAPANAPEVKGDVFNPSYGTNAPASAAKGRKRSTVLDPLVD